MTSSLETEKLIENLISVKRKDSSQRLVCNPVLALLVTGVCDEDCPLSLLAGVPQILSNIWCLVLKYWWRFIYQADTHDFDIADDGITPPFESPFMVKLERVVPFLEHKVFERDNDFFFPEPTGINITMMPFTMASKFEDSYLPDYLKPYWDGILGRFYSDEYDYRCSQFMHGDDYHNVGYLTIREGLIKANETQSKKGLHTLYAGTVQVVPCKKGHYLKAEKGSEDRDESLTIKCHVGKGSFVFTGQAGYDDYGYGEFDDFGDETYVNWMTENVGGAFIATNVSDSFKVYNCCVYQDEETGEDIIGENGDLEFLQDIIPEDSGSRVMKANKLYWVTDRTPIKALPLKEDTYVQYIQIVKTQLGVWYEELYTKNPRGIIPDPTITKIIKRSSSTEGN